MVENVPRVTSLTSMYNSARWLECALEHLIAQDYLNLEILVIDSGSTDNTAEVCRKFKIIYYRTHREPLYVSWNRELA